LSEDIDINPVIILLNGLGRNKLGDDWTISVDLVLKSSIKVLLLDGVGHNNQEEIEVLALFWLKQLSTIRVFSTNVCAVIVIDSVLESLDSRFVA
jgi:hypothetical protein